MSTDSKLAVTCQHPSREIDDLLIFIFPNSLGRVWLTLNKSDLTATELQLNKCNRGRCVICLDLNSLIFDKAARPGNLSYQYQHHCGARLNKPW